MLPEQYDESKDDGAGTVYKYNVQGKVIEVKNALGQTVTKNTYDPKGNLKTSIDGENNKVEYTYTLLGQIKDITTPNSRNENKVAQSYSYDARGNITGIVDGNGNETKYLLDDWGRIIQITTPEGGVEKYTYDYAGNITSTTDANGGTIQYFYNSLGQVSEIKDQEGLSEYFLYAYCGNNPVNYYDPSGYSECPISKENNFASDNATKGVTEANPNRVRADMLKQKYSNLSPAQRKERLNQLAEENAKRILTQMESNIPGAHFLEKHGAQTTLQSQLNRVQNGVNPTTQVVETYRNGRIKRPSAATRFLSHRDELNMINRAKQILKNTQDIDKAQNKITFTNPIGEGYKKAGLQYGKAYSGQVFFNTNNQPITAFPKWGE